MSRNCHKKPGQSVPLIALMIVVIVAMVGLSVDVGNAYGQQRRMQDAANSGALAGMNGVMANQRNQDIWTNVQRTMAGNRVDNASSAYNYRADYVLENGDVVMLGTWNGSTAYVPNGTQSAPKNIVRVQVTITERVDTYFATVIGRDSMTVNANGNACIGTYGLGVYPLGIPFKLKAFDPRHTTERYHRIFKTNGTEMAPTDPNWSNWDKMKGMSIYLPVENMNDRETSMSGTHISWLSWQGGNRSANELDFGMTYPGTLQEGFVEAEPFDKSLPNTKPFKQLTLGDWVHGDTGVRTQLEDELNAHNAKNRDVILPIYDVAGKVNGGTSFHVNKMGVFRITDYQFNGGTKFIKVQYLNDAKTSPSVCASEPDPDDDYQSAKRFNVEGVTKVNRVWGVHSQSKVTADIVIVMDTSKSMAFDWNDRHRSTNGFTGARIEDAKKAITDFVQGYDLKADPDARVSFVTFNGEGSNAAKVQVNWTTSGCTTAQIDAGTCAPDKRWAAVQTKAKTMIADGHTPGPIAFETVEDLLRSKRTPPAGKQYRQIVLFATDGVFNVCGKDRGAQDCPYGTLVKGDGSSTNPEYYLNNPEYNLVSGRPVWQAQQVASRIKNAGARVFVVALTPRSGSFNPAGLPEMSSGTGYYYQADDGGAMANIYSKIKGQIAENTCQPMETWQQAEGAQIKLTQPNNPTFIKTTIADTNGQWKFDDLEAGQYVVKSDPLVLASKEDGKTRRYSRVRNGLNLSEETQGSVYINPQYPNGSVVYSELLLSLPIGPDGAPLSGCNTP